MTDTPPGVLKGRIDRYNGVTIHSEVLPSTKEEFEEKLFVSMKWWRSNRVRAVWLQIPLVHSDFIAPAAEAGFLYHHARPEYVYMNQWLAADEVNKLPLDTNTSVGVGGFVMNDNGELLVVKEKHWGKYAPWKLPGGMADPGEDIGVAAAREILEETNIEAKFESIIAFRHSHHSLFHSSNFYFICRMKALTHDITMEEAEILDARWIPLEEYLADPSVTPLNRKIAHLAQRNLDFPSPSEYVGQSVLGWSKQWEDVFYYAPPKLGEDEHVDPPSPRGEQRI